MNEQITALIADLTDWIENTPGTGLTWISGEEYPWPPTREEAARAKRQEEHEAAWKARREPLADSVKAIAVSIGSVHLFRLADLIRDRNTSGIRDALRTLRPELELAAAARNTTAVPLGERTQKVLDIIREFGPITESEIERKLRGTALEVVPGTIRKHDIPFLKERYGVRNDRKGYYIPK